MFIGSLADAISRTGRRAGLAAYILPSLPCRSDKIAPEASAPGDIGLNTHENVGDGVLHPGQFHLLTAKPAAGMLKIEPMFEIAT
ncbi:MULTISPECIES: hypothetical protein [unclassified Mesorhizobium]|uniref:hypothetical protein n=1 Tax=unclassified Mesorhizobium TaxID=325217 RepID=UPI000FDA5123|nr:MULTISPECIES: hypothetical protein [unclassified Mesorhizobium]TGQ04950.1 hypothetical protein EN862_032225 [Mesorhizobium sp. M2E.F.Ca.ET.219.01.1.1]TGT65610.1 hypothetical protein EN809_032800 [Mesorhizobium sp. M2E.F.Ca.ET.166.01.1.1]TGV97657.1 hypothetical protein EN797_032810 [Mesorhizobium sp. M2E.F.Ca.ET.154.01.1.1]